MNLYKIYVYVCVWQKGDIVFYVRFSTDIETLIWWEMLLDRTL
jgi:hypothetical protein